MKTTFRNIFLCFYINFCLLVSQSTSLDLTKLDSDTKSYKSHLKKVLNKCLNHSSEKKMTLEGKLKAFQNSNCPPIILIPGFWGSKLEFRMKNCDTFKKFHSNIMQSCGWTDCNAKELRSFKIWVNFDINESEIMGAVLGGVKETKSSQNGQHIPKLIVSIKVNNSVIKYPLKEGCLGNLFRVYYTHSNTSNGINYEISQLQGAEVNVLKTNPNECGRDTITNFLGKYSVQKEYQGFKLINEYLNNLGYVKGISLFNQPYDFRLSIDKIIPYIDSAVKTAYRITKKKPILIGHSFGGLIAYKYSLKTNNLISEVIAIGSPFKGVFLAAHSFLIRNYQLNIKKVVNAFGFNIELHSKIDLLSSKLMHGTFNSLHFLPKPLLGDETDEALQEIFKKEKSQVGNTEYNNENSKFKEFIEYFYKIFPKVNDQCKAIQHPLLKYNPACKVNYYDFINNPLIVVDGEEILLGKQPNEVFMKYYAKKSNEDKEIFNLNINDNFKIDLNAFIKSIFETQEREVFTYKNPNIPFTFIFSNHVATESKIYLENGKVTKSEYSTGDGTADSFTQIYPGLRWIYEGFKNKKETSTVHFIEYCAIHPNKNLKIYNKNKSQYISIGCDCLNNNKLEVMNDCFHPSMINDTQLVRFLGKLILKSESKKEIVPNFEDLYNSKFNKQNICSNLK